MLKQHGRTQNQLPNAGKRKRATEGKAFRTTEHFDTNEEQIHMQQLMAKEWSAMNAYPSNEEWKESQNGNFYRPLDDGTNVTVLLCKDGRWRGISDERITDESFDSSEEAMSAIDQGDVSFVPFRPRDTGWKAAKRGGLYRQVHGIIYTIKQSPKGNWFVMDGDTLVKNHWFPTADAAKKYVATLIGNEF